MKSIIAPFTFLVLVGCATAPPRAERSDVQPADRAEREETVVRREESVREEKAADESTADRDEAAVSEKSAEEKAVDESTTERAVGADEVEVASKTPAAGSAAVEPADKDASSGSEVVSASESASTVSLPVRVTRVLANGVVDSTRTFSYQPGTDRMILETVELSENRIRRRIEYTYRDDGAVEIVRSGADGLVESRTIRTYVEGRLVREEQLDSRGKVQFSSRYEYDRPGVVRWLLFDGDEVLLSESAYTYEGDRLVRVDNRDGDGVLQEYLVHDYDGAGRLVSITTFDAIDGAEIERTTYDYDDGDRVETMIERRPGFARETRYEYDDSGNVTAETVFGGRGELLYANRYEYEELPVSTAGGM